MKLLIAMPTRGRPGLLAQALRSVAAMTPPAGWDTSVAVVVNAADAAEVARTTRIVGEAVGPYPALTVGEPTPGPALARNRALLVAQSAGADALFFMDDDQTAPPDLLDTLARVLEEEGADVVMPRLAWRFEEPARNRDWIDPPPKRRHAGPRSRGLAHARSGGVLFRRRLWREMGLRFDTRFPFAGGEDIDFFSRARKAGALIVETRETFITEYCPREKQSTAWLLRFEFRRGNIGALYLLNGRSRAREAVEGSLKTLWFSMAAIACILSPRRRRRCVQRAVRGAGAVAGALGGASDYYRRTIGD